MSNNSILVKFFNYLVFKAVLANNLEKVALRWREEIDIGDIHAIQKSEECQAVIRKLGYLQVKSNISDATEVLTSLNYEALGY